MTHIKPFLNHINESEDRAAKLARLKGLGLTQNDSPEDTIRELQAVFYEDPQLKSLLDQIDARVGELFAPILERADEEAEEWEDLRQDMSWTWADDAANYWVWNAISDFGNYMEESVEHPDREQNIERLRGLGLAPKKEFDERWEEMVDEWGQDPEINHAIYTLKMKTSQIIDKYIDFDDSEDMEQWEQRQDWMFQSSIDDLGWLEWMIASGEL